jgi:pilus assembly protein Flp/PilA
MRFFNRFFQDDSGSNALEYGLIVALVSLAVVTGAGVAGTALGAMFNALGTRLTTLTTTIAA